MRIREWDFIRGFATAYVLVYHFFEISETTGLIAGRDGVVNHLLFGSHGFGLFVILSGLCNAYALNIGSRGRSSEGWFFRRLLRIYPPYWLALIFTTVLYGVSIGPKTVLHALGVNVLLGEDFYYPHNPPLWFIGLIVQLYLLLPILLYLGCRTGFGSLLAILISASSILRFREGPFTSNLFRQYPSFFVLMVGEFTFGIFFARSFLMGKGRFESSVSDTRLLLAAVFSYLIITIGSLGGGQIAHLLTALESLATVSLFLAVYFTAKAARGHFRWAYSSLEFLSRHSLQIFLLQYPIMYKVISIMGNLGANIPLTFAISLLTVIFFALLVDSLLGRMTGKRGGNVGTL